MLSYMPASIRCELHAIRCVKLAVHILTQLCAVRAGCSTHSFVHCQQGCAMALHEALQESFPAGSSHTIAVTLSCSISMLCYIPSSDDCRLVRKQRSRLGLQGLWSAHSHTDALPHRCTPTQMPPTCRKGLTKPWLTILSCAM